MTLHAFLVSGGGPHLLVLLTNWRSKALLLAS
jgi:hypothetical protein